MKERMNVKKLKEFLSNFPDDAIVCTDTNNHTSNDGITCATLFKSPQNGERLLYIGNGSMMDSHRYIPDPKYLKLEKQWSVYNGWGLTIGK